MRRWAFYSLVFIFLVACGGNTYRAPVESRREQAKPIPGSYSVQKGDTLFSIAWRYGMDYRKIATNNNILPPYTIFPGEKLYLGQKPPAAPRKPVTSTPVAKSSSGGNSKGTTKTPAPASAPAVKTPVAVAGKTVAKPLPNRVVSKWQWPTSGRVTRGYSVSLHKGIDIGGKRGDAIYAVAAGKVVYAGSGIVGYGQLLIVRHNEVYLSAYGHNGRLLLSEGDPVTAGQKIAEKGSSGTDTVKLHFEIRKEGKPIDPNRLLPRK